MAVVQARRRWCHYAGAVTIAAFALALPSAGFAQAMVPGTVTVERPSDVAPVVQQAFAEAVSTALLAAGFLTLPHGQGRYVARLTITRVARGVVAAPAARSGSPLAVGNWGVQLQLPSGKTRLSTLLVTELTIEIAARIGTGPAWRGRALTVAAEGSAKDDPDVLAPRLAQAALAGFPAVRAEPVSVP